MKQDKGREGETGASSEQDLGLPSSILRLLGDEVHILHPLASDSAELGGGDIDCAVSGLDFSWPLRLPLEYRLVQYLHYDVRGWAWVLERDGVFVIVDAIDDPTGINRLGFATSSLSHGSRPLASSSTRAAYLTAKRIWKGQVDQPRWASIHQLMGEGGADFLVPLRQTFGKYVAAKLEMSIRRGQIIDRHQRVLARTTQFVRRLRTPRKFLSLLYRAPARVVERLLRPTGLFILLIDRREGNQPLPSPQVALSLRGPLMRQCTIAATEAPRTAGSHASLSLASLFLGWLRALMRVAPSIWKHRVAKGLVIVEGGWWQKAFSQGSGSARRRAATVLAGLLPLPDLTFVVGDRSGGDPLRLPTTDLEFIRRAVRGRVRVVDQERLVRDVQETGLSLLESRAVRRMGTGWIGLSDARSEWIIPRGPRSAVMSTLAIHRPPGRRYVPSSRVTEAALSGLVRLLPRGASPSAEIRALLSDHLLPHGTLSVARTSKPGRYIATILDANGSPQAVAKLATDPEGVKALARERTILEGVFEHTTDALRIPQVIDYEPGVLLLEPEAWLRQSEPWRIPVEAANALGHLLRQEGGPSDDAGLVHGDCTYLNLRHARTGWILLDWEDARESERGMTDLFHHLLVSHATFTHPSVLEIRNGLQKKGWVWDVLDAYITGIGIQIDDLAPAFLDFLSGGTQGGPVEPLDRADTRKLLARELRL